MSSPWPPPPSGVGAGWTQYPPGTPTSNGIAIAAMVVGIVTALAVLSVIFVVVAFVPGIAAVVLGFSGLRRSRQHPARLGRGAAISGIVFGLIGTVISLGAIAIIALFVASSDFTITDERVAEVDEYRLSDRTCGVEDGRAVASGVLESSAPGTHGFVVTVRFVDGNRELGVRSDEIENGVDEGQRWSWSVDLLVDRRQVNTDTLDCEVVRVDIGDVVSD